MQKIVIFLLLNCINFYTHAEYMKDITVENKKDGSIDINIKGQDIISIDPINDNPAQLNFIIKSKINNRNYILISTKDNRISYRDSRMDYDMYSIFYAYDCTNKCTYDNKISNFFGNGGNVISSENDEILFNYIYDKKENVLKDLNSKLFKKWYSGNLKDGEVINKTTISDVSNYNPDAKAYLIKGDKFKIKDISSRWINIVYKNPRGKLIEGWIQCKDTNICQEN